MMTLNSRTATLSEVVGIEEAANLLEWLQQHPKGKLNLKACTHLHSANLQVLMVMRPTIQSLPDSPVLRDWIQSACPGAPSATFDKG